MSDPYDKKPPSSSGSGATKAGGRLHQIVQHLDKPSSTSGSEGQWSDITSQLTQLRELAKIPPEDTRGYQMQRLAGKLWVRERIEKLLDPNSFREVGSVSGTVTWKSKREESGKITEEVEKFVPSSNLQGFGTINGREVVLTADDFTLRGGHADGASMEKTVYIEQLSGSLKLPIIKLVDGASGGGSVTTYREVGHAYVPGLRGFRGITKLLDGGIPNVGAALGPAIGYGAARLAICHFTVMARDVGALINAGPKVVEGATFEEGLSVQDLGGPMVHCTNGTIDNAADNEIECFKQIAQFLSYVPNCSTDLPPVIESSDPPSRKCPELREIIPRRIQRMYKMRTIITSVVDADSFFEIGALWGLTSIVGLARVAGHPIGILANDPEHLSGALDALGSQKLAKHIKLCDVFGLPIVQFVDCPGYAIGTSAEKAATMRWGVELAKAYYSSTTPVFSVLVRKCYGVAGAVMVDNRVPNLRVAWPSGSWGSLPLDGGIEVGHQKQLREAGPNRDALYKELWHDYERLSNPVRTANAFGIEEIIDPADTRQIACTYIKHMYGAVLKDRHVKIQRGDIHVSFR